MKPAIWVRSSSLWQLIYETLTLQYLHSQVLKILISSYEARLICLHNGRDILKIFEVNKSLIKSPLSFKYLSTPISPFQMLKFKKKSFNSGYFIRERKQIPRYTFQALRWQISKFILMHIGVCDWERTFHFGNMCSHCLLKTEKKLSP